MYDEDMDMEELAMSGGKKDKEKPVKLSTGAKDTLGCIEKIIAGVEAQSIASYKKMSTDDKKALKEAYSELSEMCYTAKSLIRESYTDEEEMIIMMGRD